MNRLVAVFLLTLLSSGCSSPSPPSPFAVGGAGGSAGGAQGGGGAGGDEPDPTLGGPCTVDEQCDDGFDCTSDGCDLDILRCRFQPDDSQCQNEFYCDGLEICNNKLGCILGEPITCSDGSACSIDTCDEASHECLTVPRDVDLDGDPDDHCGGGDCDNLNPMVSSEHEEICGNGDDDDCDGDVDEPECAAPANDTCLDPLLITDPGTYAMYSAAAALDYAASCSVENPAAARDVIADIQLAAGPDRDVQLTAKSENGDVAVALMGQCDQPGSEIACSPGYDHPEFGRVAKVRGRSLGDAGSVLDLPAYVFSNAPAALTLRYEILPASIKPTNETCGTADPIAPGTPTIASIVDAVVDLGTSCPALTGDLVYSFTLATDQDVDIYAVSVDGDGRPIISLRDAACALPTDELTCAISADGTSSAHVFRHSVPAGTYYLSIAATAPTDVIFTLEVSAATPAPPDEDCGSPPAIPVNQTIDVLLEPHEDDVDVECLAGAADAVYALDLAQPSDVLLLGRYSSGDTAAVAIATEPCDVGDALVCGLPGTLPPTRARKRNLAPGSYRVIAESQQNQPMELTALVRPAVPTIVVPFANTCDEALTIPATGGFFQGTTANAQADYDAGCDQGGLPPGGAPEQILALELSTEKRVILDMQGSGYATLLDVREGPACPGMEMPFACAIGAVPERSFLDLTLAPAVYYIQVDGYAGQAGPWFLDIHVIDP